MPELPKDPRADPSAAWSRLVPRTTCLTISTGTRVEAHPYTPGRIAARSVDFGTEVDGEAGAILPVQDNWLLKAAEAVGVSGVLFVLENLEEGLRSAGLGGSATAITAVCLLANRLAGEPLDGPQIVALAARLENDLGMSLTGTQEQSNVVYGGAIDYVWFPWGVPGEPRQGLGTSLRFELVPPEGYPEIEARFAIVHTGKTRFSATVNEAWVECLRSPEAFPGMRELPAAAYEYREGVRTSEWPRVSEGLRAFRQIRIDRVPSYMAGAEELAEQASEAGLEAFPLGAGGGGSSLLFAEDPRQLTRFRETLRNVREIGFRLQPEGHRFVNL